MDTCSFEEKALFPTSYVEICLILVVLLLLLLGMSGCIGCSQLGTQKTLKASYRRIKTPGDSKKQLHLHPANAGPSDQLKVSLITHFLEVNEQNWFWKTLLRLLVSIFYFHYKCRSFKHENSKVSFHYFKKFIQKSHAGCAAAEILGQMQFLARPLFFYLLNMSKNPLMKF